MIRKLRAEKATLEAELTTLRANERDKIASTSKHWEKTCDDLTREIGNAHSDLAEREQTARELQQELQAAQNQLDDVA